MKFHVFKSPTGSWFFNLRARNGRIILQSEGYRRKAGCLNAIKAIQASAAAPVVMK